MDGFGTAGADSKRNPASSSSCHLQSPERRPKDEKQDGLGMARTCCVCICVYSDLGHGDVEAVHGESPLPFIHVGSCLWASQLPRCACRSTAPC